MGDRNGDGVRHTRLRLHRVSAPLDGRLLLGDKGRDGDDRCVATAHLLVHQLPGGGERGRRRSAAPFLRPARRGAASHPPCPVGSQDVHAGGSWRFGAGHGRNARPEEGREVATDLPGRVFLPIGAGRSLRRRNVIDLGPLPAEPAGCLFSCGCRTVSPPARLVLSLDLPNNQNLSLRTGRPFSSPHLRGPDFHSAYHSALHRQRQDQTDCKEAMVRDHWTGVHRRGSRPDHLGAKDAGASDT